MDAQFSWPSLQHVCLDLHQALSLAHYSIGIQIRNDRTWIFWNNFFCYLITMYKSKQTNINFRSTMHCCAMFFLFLILMTELLSTASSANCLDGLVRKPPRFGKRSDFPSMHPCFVFQRRSDRLSKLKLYFEKNHSETGETALENFNAGQGNNSPNLLLKLISILRRKTDHWQKKCWKLW